MNLWSHNFFRQFQYLEYIIGARLTWAGVACWYLEYLPSAGTVRQIRQDFYMKLSQYNFDLSVFKIYVICSFVLRRDTSHLIHCFQLCWLSSCFLFVILNIACSACNEHFNAGHSTSLNSGSMLSTLTILKLLSVYILNIACLACNEHFIAGHSTSLNSVSMLSTLMIVKLLSVCNIRHCMCCM